MSGEVYESDCLMKLMNLAAMILEKFASISDWPRVDDSSRALGLLLSSNKLVLKPPFSASYATSLLA